MSCISARRIATTALAAGMVVKVIGLTHDRQWVDANRVLHRRRRGRRAGLPRRPAPPPVRPLALGHLDEGLPPGSVVFPVLHGPFGEDGVIQGHLETLDMPYVGAGVLASAMCMDKGIAKSVLHDHGLPVAAWRLVARAQWSAVVYEGGGGGPRPADVREARQPRIVHRRRQGVRRGSDWATPCSRRSSSTTTSSSRSSSRGRELELALIGNEDVRVSQAGEIIASQEFYDYDDKYVLGTAETVAPTDLKGPQLAHAQRVASAAYRALRVEGLARVDLFLADDDEIVVNEVNTMPGFTPDLHVPHALGGRGSAVRVRRRGARAPGPGSARPAPAAADPPRRRPSRSKRKQGAVAAMAEEPATDHHPARHSRSSSAITCPLGPRWAPQGPVGHDRRRSDGCSEHPFCTVRSVVMTFEGLESDTWEALPGANRLTVTQREAIESDEPLAVRRRGSRGRQDQGAHAAGGPARCARVPSSPIAPW